jgi:hypothetical protein
MSDLNPLKLVALSSKADESLIPPLQQVVIFTRMLAYICELELQHLPEKPFKRIPCAPSDREDLDEGVGSKGIDFLGLYESAEGRVTLNVCRIRKFSFRHALHLDDAVKIVLIHELAHYVTHLGTNSGAYWEDFWKADSREKEEFAQDATHLLLRVAGYGHLVNVFDSLSHLCPKEYNSWRQTWKQRRKSKHSDLSGVLVRRSPTKDYPEASSGDRSSVFSGND